MDVGQWIRVAREALGLTQEELGSSVGLSRYAVMDMERGERRVAADELIALSRELERPLEYFFTGEPSFDASVAQRNDGPVSVRVKRAQLRLQHRLHDYKLLRECLDGLPDLANLVARVKRSGSTVAKANEAARQQREMLGLGSSPIADVRLAIEERLGVPVFGAVLDQDPAFCGMLLFLADAPLAGMLFNSCFQVSRCNFTIAHEWGHLVWQLSLQSLRGDLFFTGEESNSEEMFCNAYAAQLLAPDAGIANWLAEHQIAPSDLSPETVQWLASDFGVSFKAMTYRLQNAGHLDDQLAEAWRTEVRVSRLRYYTSEFSAMPDMSPTFKHHVLCAYQEGQLTAAKCGEMLDMTGVQFMELVDAAGTDVFEEATAAETR